MSRFRSSPLLSILIPAYCYPEGVGRLLRGIGHFDPELIEILVGDDSPDSRVEAVVKAAGRQGVHYVRNVPPLGAPANWNALILKASGEFCLMLHHDEFPLSADFLARLLGRLTDSMAHDVLLLDCVLVDTRTGWNRRHLPFTLRMAIVSHAPSYILRRNAVGPVSVLVIRRSLYPKFDPRLKWLVDADLYLRLFSRGPTVVACPEIAVGTELGRNESITVQLSSRLKAITADEHSYLYHKHEKLAIWCKDSTFHRLTRTVECVCWVILRAVTRAFSWPPPTTREAALHAARRVERSTSE